ncbi:MAG: hypothetical protein QGG19_07230 [Alphaproteobacteria bacterium]|jgi:cytochrome c oxidase subunit 2|nr:hypothetical protein [Alphaproteobacteria bacterium]MDP6255975.1 hypothetical protein [Alphaproteobacteria bacterium]MDP7054273.1 hypothetical protein [Alphaproteobacteria bacterium]MDP7229933.1 hypothetical protein [Alphaproteobacteria bacterium]MDP7460050.1 hypothetical protein [Alphaproteobacteria bacterium]|tara:strand:- start:3616 stop:4173 length:558 start_codon:yes stop_codon:yes gene_type:complete
MLDSLFQNASGAYFFMLCLQIPFLVVFLYIIYRKGFANPDPSDADQRKLSRVDGLWVTFVIILFLGINIASIEYMPPISSARAVSTQQNIRDVDVTAESWSYEMSAREFEVGQAVRFSAKSADTMHSFAIYHPDGRMLFTMMLMPGLETPASIVHTFTEPGIYKVRCLEYCGAAHHEMRDEIVVK